MNQCACGRDLEAGFLCAGDATALARRLDRMSTLWDVLEGFLAPSGTAGGERVSAGHAGSRAPVNEVVLDLRTVEVVKTLESWREYAAEWRGWSRPAVGGDVRHRIVAAARNLSMNLDWLVTEFPPVVDMAVEVRELERSVLSVVGALPERGRRIGQCVAVDSSGVVCGATIRHQRGQTRLVCDWCGTSYGPEDFLTLARLQPDEAA
ncbi:MULTISPECIES: hypothetical protein [Streptomyces]|uniref:Uncharacterized protein n=1 Tax=Streptomyces dengpaensis TaxID=2049881 RepID=A0ABN5I4C7_9ACTN|nr:MULTISPECIES: hypothetical protein [Streptomyces]AVH57867.1 hypothetical protein C4B68_21230 [Streptomyces dengpaensis]PIB04836.1 hypothetical protein B1C81_31305 [Streptomyces sp. HG99]